MVVSNRNLLFQGSIFRCYVSFREGTFPRVFPVFWYIVSPLTSTLGEFWEVQMRGVNHQPINDDSMGILKGYPSNSWLPCGQTGFKQFFVWGRNYSVKKRIPMAYPLIFQLTRYLEPGVDRYLIYKFQIHFRNWKIRAIIQTNLEFLEVFWELKMFLFFIEVEHHHVEEP